MIGCFSFDHVIAAVQNLDVAAGLVRSTFGWGVSGGGRHPGGTHNQSVPLGGEQYLELLAVYDDALPTGHDVAQRLAEGEGWFGWAVRDDDLEATAARLGLKVREGSIETSEGRRGSWRIAGWEQARESDGALPFFINYGSADRKAVWADRYAQALHVDAPVSIAWVEVSFSEESVQRSLGGAKLDVRVTDGPRGLRAVGISLAEDRMVELRDWPTELVQS